MSFSVISVSRSKLYVNWFTDGIDERPKPMWSGATRWYLSASELMRLRNMCELDGKPCSNSSVGLDLSPASR